MNKGYVNSSYLDNASKVNEHIKQQSYLNMSLKPDSTVLDLGCGPGIDTKNLLKTVSKGFVLGIDYDPEMVKLANARSNATHMIGSAYFIPFPDDYFDSIRSERLFQHLTDPMLAMKEIYRTTKKGGKIVLVDTDWSSLFFNSPLSELESNIVTNVINNNVNNHRSGKLLYKYIKESGFNNITVQVNTLLSHSLEESLYLSNFKLFSTNCNVIEYELHKFLESLEMEEQKGTFLAGVDSYIVSGTK